MLLVILCYQRQKYVAAWLIFVVALFTKEMAIVTAALLVWQDFCFTPKDKTQKHRWLLWMIFIITALVSLKFRQAITGANLLGDIAASGNELILRLGAIGNTVSQYIAAIFVPVDLHYYRSTDILQNSILGWGIVVLTLGLWVLIRSTLKEADRLLWQWALGVFVITLLPTLNIIPLVNEYSFILSAEHFLYMPMIGVAVMVVMALERLPIKIAKWVVMLVLVVCGVMTFKQNTVWSSEIALFERTVRFEPHFARGHLLLAKAYYFDRRYLEAQAHYDKALQRMQFYLTQVKRPATQKFYRGFIKGIHFDSAANDMVLGHWDQAAAHYLAALAIDPNDCVVHNSLGVLSMNQGDFNQAIRVFDGVPANCLTDVMILNNKAICYIQKGKWFPK